MANDPNASAEPAGIVSYETNSCPANHLTVEERTAALAGIDRLIHRIAYQSGLPQSEHDDLASEIRMRVWSASVKYEKGGAAKFSTWATHVARNVVKDYQERYYKQCRGGDGKHAFDEFRDEHFAPVDATELADLKPENVAFIRKADAQFRRGVFADKLDSLSPAARQIVELVAIDGLSLARVAVLVGQKESIVQLTARHAIHQLEKEGMVANVALRQAGLNRTTLKNWAMKTRLEESRSRIALLRELPLGELDALTQGEVADMFSCDSNQARRALRAARVAEGLPRLRPKVPKDVQAIRASQWARRREKEESRAKLRSLIDAGASFEEMAAALCIGVEAAVGRSVRMRKEMNADERATDAGLIAVAKRLVGEGVQSRFVAGRLVIPLEVVDRLAGAAA